MKQYGYNKATKFTAKQISVIYGKAKAGVLKVEKWFIKELYDLANYYGMDSNRSVETHEREVKSILALVFSGDFETAQNFINEMQDSWFNLKGRKEQAKCDRNAFVA